MNDQDADKALLELFHTSGRIAASEGIETRILERIAHSNRPIAPASALIPGWVWATLAGGAVTLTAYLFAVATPTIEVGPIERALTNLPRFPLDSMLSSPWLLVTATSAIALLAMDTVLNRMRLDPHVKH
ncbi:MAG: hypothetical protein IPK99_03800 [Flavobacteriales bacterium]|nr:hypothetical protein [Flavobacteriales bacterium]